MLKQLLYNGVGIKGSDLLLLHQDDKLTSLFQEI